MISFHFRGRGSVQKLGKLALSSRWEERTAFAAFSKVKHLLSILREAKAKNHWQQMSTAKAAWFVMSYLFPWSTQQGQKGSLAIGGFSRLMGQQRSRSRDRVTSGDTCKFSEQRHHYNYFFQVKWVCSFALYKRGRLRAKWVTLQCD